MEPSPSCYSSFDSSRPRTGFLLRAAMVILPGATHRGSTPWVQNSGGASINRPPRWHLGLQRDKSGRPAASPRGHPSPLSGRPDRKLAPEHAPSHAAGGPARWCACAEPLCPGNLPKMQVPFNPATSLPGIPPRHVCERMQLQQSATARLETTRVSIRRRGHTTGGCFREGGEGRKPPPPPRPAPWSHLSLWRGGLRGWPRGLWGQPGPRSLLALCPAAQSAPRRQGDPSQPKSEQTEPHLTRSKEQSSPGAQQPTPAPFAPSPHLPLPPHSQRPTAAAGLSLQHGTLRLEPLHWLFLCLECCSPRHPQGLPPRSRSLASSIKLQRPSAFSPTFLALFSLLGTTHHQIEVALICVLGWLSPQLEHKLQKTERFTCLVRGCTLCRQNHAWHTVGTQSTFAKWIM